MDAWEESYDVVCVACRKNAQTKPQTKLAWHLMDPQTGEAHPLECAIALHDMEKVYDGR